MKEKIQNTKTEAIGLVSQARDMAELENIRISFLGRHGKLTEFIKELPKLKIEDRREAGRVATEAKQVILETIARKKQKLVGIKERGFLDLTVPGEKPIIGHLHPISQLINQTKQIFRYLGFTWTDGPEIELDEYNFQKLRIPRDHPARDLQQTYYLTENLVLRTHTSPMQIRYMETHKPPIRVIGPGKVFRRDPVDVTHLPAFYQIEGMAVDRDIKMTDLVGVIEFYTKAIFGPQTKIRTYGHHFPYTEPSIEVELFHPKLNQWVEILGAGMIHPEVLANGGINPKKFRGWAFGVGVERIIMLKYGIEDVRLFYSGDLRFLEQF